MSGLRSIIAVRCIAAFVVVSMLMLAIMPVVSHRGAYSTYGEWLRMQVRGPVDAAFNDALAEAEERKHRDVQSFLHAFLDAYDGPAEDVAAAFGMEGLEGPLLVSYLQTRFANLAPDAVLNRTVLAAAQQITSLTDRLAGSLATTRDGATFGPAWTHALQDVALLPTPASLLLTPIHPRGP